MAQLKFLLDYSLSLGISENADQNVFINPPMTVEFDIRRNNFAQANEATFRIMNLSSTTRNLIRVDQWDLGQPRRGCKFIAGYNPNYAQTKLRGIQKDPSQTSSAAFQALLTKYNLSMCFNGLIQRAFSQREGENFVTTVVAHDNGLMQYAPDISQNWSEAGDYSNQDIVKDIVAYLGKYGVTPGAVGSFEGSPSRGVTYSGKPTDILHQLTNGQYAVDLNQLNCLQDNECLDLGNVPVITSSSGLLDTPELQNLNIMVKMIFSPEFRIFQKVKLDSSTSPDKSSIGQTVFNQFCRINGIAHHGVISDAVSGPTITELTMLPGDFIGVEING